MVRDFKLRSLVVCISQRSITFMIYFRIEDFGRARGLEVMIPFLTCSKPHSVTCRFNL